MDEIIVEKDTKDFPSEIKDVSYVVQKSRPLFALWQSDITLSEFKILDIYLSRIDSHAPENRVVMFDRKDLEKILEVTKINNKVLEERLKHLMGHVVKIPDKDDNSGYRLVTLFEEANIIEDGNGVKQIRLECTSKAMKYFFNIESLGYLKYKLRNIVNIKSRYTYIMFLYLESNRYRVTWEESLESLKKTLNCDTQETYKEYKYFNKMILKKIHTELQEKTTCKYTYKPIRRGGSVDRIRFTLETFNEIEYFSEMGETEPAEDEDENVIDATVRESELWEETIKDFSFSPDQINEIRANLVVVPSYKFPNADSCHDSIDIQRYHYMEIKVAELMVRNKKRAIKNKYLYLLKMIKSDITES